MASPFRHLSAGMPPCLVCAGESDPLYRQSVLLSEALDRLGVAHDDLLLAASEYPRARHGFLNIPHFACTEAALERAGNFIRKHSAPG
jgi:acetyl esterase/lipase